MPGAPVTDYLSLAFFIGVAIYMMFDLSDPTWYYSLIAGVVILAGTNIGYEIAKRNPRSVTATQK